MNWHVVFDCRENFVRLCSMNLVESVNGKAYYYELFTGDLRRWINVLNRFLRLNESNEMSFGIVVVKWFLKSAHFVMWINFSIGYIQIIILFVTAASINVHDRNAIRRSMFTGYTASIGSRCLNLMGKMHLTIALGNGWFLKFQ